jgi:uncharacterized membrane protein
MTPNHLSSNQEPVNVGRTERTISAIAGSLLLYYVSKKNKGAAFMALASGYLLYRAVSGHCTVYSAVGRIRNTDHPSNINIRTSVTVNRPRDEVYAFWRKLENLPLFMKHLENVDQIDETTSAWKIRIPGGLGELRWEASIVNEEEGSVLSWQSAPGAVIKNAGKINFSDTPGKGTRIDALISYRAPFGRMGEKCSRLLTPVFSALVEKDILSFKEYMEDARVAGLK